MDNRYLQRLFSGENCYQTQPLVIVLSGPSGVGKDAAIMEMKKQGLNFHYAVTATTRPIRPGEKDNVHYHFMSDESFKKMIRENQFLEWARVYDYFYGVPVQEVKYAIKNGQDVILKIDVQGASTIRQLLPEAVFIFIVPSSIEVLAQRLKERGNQSNTDYKSRILKAEAEMNQKCLFDYVVVNYQDQLYLTAFRINSIIIAEKHRSVSRLITL